MAGRGAYQKKSLNTLNVKARHKFLLESIGKPSSVDAGIHVSLAGQRAFAAMRVEKLGIVPIALNTIKSLSKELFTEPDEDGRVGFDYLNALRVRLHALLANREDSRKPEARIRRIESTADQLMDRLVRTEIHSIRQQKAYLSLYSALNGLVKSSDLPPEASIRLCRILENQRGAFAELFEPNAEGDGGIDPQVVKLLRNLNKTI
jgi:hypothetical protein